MSRSLKKKAWGSGSIWLALVIYDVVAGVRRGWDWENLIKDVLLFLVVTAVLWIEHRYYRGLTAMTTDERDKELADKLPKDRAKILLKLKEYDA